MSIAASTVTVFKPDKTLKDSVNGGVMIWVRPGTLDNRCR